MYKCVYKIYDSFGNTVKLIWRIWQILSNILRFFNEFVYSIAVKWRVVLICLKAVWKLLIWFCWFRSNLANFLGEFDLNCDFSKYDFEQSKTFELRVIEMCKHTLWIVLAVRIWSCSDKKMPTLSLLDLNTTLIWIVLLCQ